MKMEINVTIDRRYLMRRSKDQLATLILELLAELEKARRSDAEVAQ